MTLIYNIVHWRVDIIHIQKKNNIKEFDENENRTRSGAWGD